MDKRSFLKSAGLLGAAYLIPKQIFAFEKIAARNNVCTLIPSETAGPFPLDLTTNSFYFRQDVRENKTGVQMNLKFKVIGLNNCEPMPNLRVNIWHCDKDGAYSGYNVATNPGQAGLTYLRGYQLTDANGEAEFITILPGWYPGRVCHIHFQVYVSSSYAAISQLTFDHATTNSIYSNNPSLYTKGNDPMTIESDNVFADGYAFQLATLTPNATTGGYDSYLEVAIQGSGTVGVGNMEKENAKHFTLAQNFPNPYTDQTTVLFHLAESADVVLDLFDLNGKKVATVRRDGLLVGDHQIVLDTKSLGIASGNYVYQLEVNTATGIYRDCKMMTASK
jgi:protocatechuate 3,4-dioxygenase beta subunit